MADNPGLENTITGTNGDDVLTGTPLDDRLIGRSGNDTELGLGGDDSLEGGLGNDSLFGGANDDWILGRQGDDLLSGGGGADDFRFHGDEFLSGETDTIVDLNFAEGDRLVFAHYVAGTFPANPQFTDIPGQIDYSPSNAIVGGGVTILGYGGLALLVAQSLNVSASQGAADSLILQVKNEGGAIVQTIVIANGWTPYQAAVNAAPTATADLASVAEDATVAGNVLANDTDPDAADVLSVVAAHEGSAADTIIPAGGNSVIVGTYGLLTLGSNGSYSFVANTGAAQALGAGVTATDTFTYAISDGAGHTATATLTVTVTGTNDGPVTQALATTVGENGPAVTLAPNFTDLDAGDSHSTSVNTTGTLGSVTLNPDGTFAYNPNGAFESLQAGQTATDSFTYTVTDGSGAASTSTVTVTINGANDNPAALADFNGVVKNGSIAVNAANGVLKNDSDVDGNGLAVAAVNGLAANVGSAIKGTYGTLTLKADGSYGYVANTSPGALPAKIVAQDKFTYTVSDGNGGTQTETLIITVYNKGDTYARGTDGANTMTGGNKGDVLDGGNGNDVLSGGNGPDVLLGGRGDDRMTGGSGPDTFVFNASHGRDVITDFTVGLDRIQIDKDVFATFADLVAASSIEGGNLVIHTPGGGTITLWSHTSLASLHSSDFVFV